MSARSSRCVCRKDGARKSPTIKNPDFSVAKKIIKNNRLFPHVYRKKLGSNASLKNLRRQIMHLATVFFTAPKLSPEQSALYFFYEICPFKRLPKNARTGVVFVLASIFAFLLSFLYILEIAPPCFCYIAHAPSRFCPLLHTHPCVSFFFVLEAFLLSFPSGFSFPFCVSLSRMFARSIPFFRHFLFLFCIAARQHRLTVSLLSCFYRIHLCCFVCFSYSYSPIPTRP